MQRCGGLVVEAVEGAGMAQVEAGMAVEEAGRAVEAVGMAGVVAVTALAEAEMG